MLELKERENRTVKEKVYHAVVDPGLETYILPKKGYSKKYAVFSPCFGSIDSSFEVDGRKLEVPEGVAHFLEHKLFEDERGNAFDRFAALGASSNAFTSFTQTSYLFSCTDNFTENLDLLLDFVQEPFFNRETVEKERGIIEQEIRMYEDHPQWRLFFNLLEALYCCHPVRNDIAGTVESIHKITPEVLYQCYRTFYHPCNMALFVVGDLSPGEVVRRVEANLKQKEHPPGVEIKRYYPREPARVNRSKVVNNMVVSEPLLNLGFKDPLPSPLKGEEMLAREMVTELLLEVLFGDSEPLYNELYEEGLINDDFGAGYTAEINYAYTLIGGETRDPELLYQKIMEALQKIRTGGISAEQLERHRRKMLGQFMSRFNSLEFIANNYLAYRFKDIDFFSFPDTLQEISLSRVEERMQEHFNEELHAVSIILPREEE